jgi:riboflavin kinase/FMN adenylyltransferase
MKIFRSFEEAKGIRNPVVTTGSFDGVHIGHKTILNRLKKLARNYDGESVLVTFEPHPRKVLYPDTIGKNLRLITSGEEKLELLRQAGLDNVIIVEFTKEFSRVTSEEFVRDFLHAILNVKVIVAGLTIISGSIRKVTINTSGTGDRPITLKLRKYLNRRSRTRLSVRPR